MVVVLASVVISVRLERYVEEAEERLLMERLARIRSRLTGKLNPAAIAKLVREDRGRS